jgi:geranylgeranyl diphosphate synthase type II
MKEYLEKQRENINRILLDSLDEVKYPEVMAEGMKYAVLNGGKRLRPLLLFMTLELLDEDIKKGEGMAGAIEMIHSYSLVHDDLPALDNDDYRRGKLTTHKKFGEANGILIGDALLTYAFYVLSTKTNGVEAEKIVKLVALTAKYAGVQGMVGGQVVDLEAEKTPADLPTLQYIHTHKTGMMLRLPIEGATIIAGLGGEKKHALLTYADLIGLAFQIKDDILDVEGTFEEMGKSVGSDQKLGKSTYPSIFGLDKAKEMLEDKIKEAVDIIEKEFGEKAEIFVKLAHYIKDRKK